MKQYFAIFIFVFFAGLFQVANTIPSQELITVSPLNWQQVNLQQGGGCDFANDKVGQLEHLTRITTANSIKHARCSSLWFPVFGNLLVLEYIGYTNAKEPGEVQILLHLRNDEQESVLNFNLPVAAATEVLNRHEFRLGERAFGQEARIEIVDSAAYAGWVSLRNKVIQLNENWTRYRIWKFLRNTKSLVFISFFLAVGIVSVILTKKLWNASLASTFFWFFIFSASIFYRHDLFFHMDEWHVMQALRDRGIEAIFRVHNEHFVPLFFLLHATLFGIFGSAYGAYILIANVLHVINALILKELLWRLSEGSFNEEGRKIICLILAAAYLLAASHCESLHWLLALPSVITATCTLLSLLFISRYFKEGRKSFLAIVVVSAASAPFFYGMGLVLGAELFGATILFYLVNIFSKQKKEYLTRSALAGTLTLGAFFVGVLSYYFIVTRSVVVDPNAQTSISQIIDYIVFGGFFATVFRGVGLYPFHSLTDIQKYVDIEMIRLVGTICGGVICLVSFAAIFLRKQNSKNLFWAWVVGMTIVFSCFVLVAPGRARLGLDQAMALRYQTVALVGLPLVLLPLVLLILRWSQGIKFLTACSVLSLSLHLFGTSQSRFLSVIGQLHRLFAVENCYWQKDIKEGSDFYKTGTAFEGLYPIVFEHSIQNPIGSVGVIHPSETVSLIEYASDDSFCKEATAHVVRNN